jgi:hypothetical protein
MSLFIVSLVTLLAIAQVTEFTFGGVGLSSTLEALAKQYPRATRVGELLYVPPGDEHHISSIALSGAGPSRRLRISFGQLSASEKPIYPACATVQKGLEARYGAPAAVRAFDEEAVRRSDRVWRGSQEELTLVCFASGKSVMAEAVVINRR